MIVFCPNCGTQNPGIPGARATCSACNSVFDVPGDAPRREPERASEPVAPPPVADRPRPSAAPPPPQPSFVQFAPRPNTTNTMAIVSFVSGLICCIPYLSPIIAVACGVSAIRQLDANRDAEKGRALAIAGIVLGALAGVIHLISTLSSVFRRF